MNLRDFGIDQDVVARVRGFDLSGYVVDGKKIGAKGAYSDVSIGHIGRPNSRDRKKVAVKHLRFHLGSDIKKLFEREIYVWSKLEHPNVARFLGYFFDDHGYPSLTSEWMERGSASDFVRAHKDIDVSNLVLGIARGLNYLHEMDAIHSDIKGQNILVSNSDPPEAIICDFGTSRIIAASLELGRPSSKENKGTIRWLAYELALAAGSSVHSKEADIWAFGMTVYELLSRKLPYYRYVIDEQVLVVISRGKLPVFEEADRQQPKSSLLKKVCDECWNLNPEERITMPEVLRMLCPDDYPEDLPPRNESSNTHNGRASASLHVGLEHTLRASDRGRIRCARFTVDGALVAVVCDRFVRLYDTQSGHLIADLDHASSTRATVQNICFNHDPDVLVTSASDRIIRVWSILQRRVLDKFSRANGDILALAYAPSGRFVVYSLSDGSLHLRDSYSRQDCQLPGLGPQAAAISIAVSPDSQTFAAGCMDSVVRIWNVLTGEHLRNFDGLSGPVKSLVFSPSGKRIVGSGGNLIRKWHVTEDAIPPVDFTGHTAQISSIALAKDACWVASSSEDGSARIWTLKYGQLVKTLTEHRDRVVSVDFSPKGGMFATASRNEIRLWSYYA